MRRDGMKRRQGWGWGVRDGGEGWGVRGGGVDSVPIQAPTAARDV